MAGAAFLRYFDGPDLQHREGSRLHRFNLSLACLVMLVAVPPGGAMADDNAPGMKPPRLSIAEIDWTAALKSLAGIPELSGAVLANAQPSRSDAERAVSPALGRLNDAISSRFPGVATSPIPVLLPIDTQALLRDIAAHAAALDNDRYLSGFRATKFFYPGLSGYDAAFTFRTGDVAEFADIHFSEPIEVQISGSSLLYELEGSMPVGQPVAELEAEFPGIKRLLYEFHLRYTFVRYGVPYVVSIGCFDGSVARYKLPTCRLADRVALRFLHALHVAGGSPQPRRVVTPPPIVRPTAISSVFQYRSPGKLLAGTGFRDLGGRTDYTVYAPIRFPLKHAPAYANTQMFQRRNPTPGFSYPWRDNFCERRSFPVGQCPAGIGHQGQDIRPAPCAPQPCHPHDELVAVRDGAILRSPRQEAAYLFVNSANEHIRFRYLHMSPRKMDTDGLLSGRLVREGEVIGEISNFSNRENGTSYHLHFDVQVPTRDGWVFVNPYMTLVAAYERLIDGRGTEVSEPVAATTSEPDNKVVVVEPPPRPAKFSHINRFRPTFRGHRFSRRFTFRAHRFGRRFTLHGHRQILRERHHRKYGKHRYARR